MKKKLRNSCLLRKANGGVFMIALLLAGFSALTLQAADTSVNRITILKENVSVLEVLVDIETQTGYKFFYSNNQVDAQRKVSIKLRDAHLKTALDVLFKNTSVTYKFLENHIVLTARKNLSESTDEMSTDLRDNLLLAVNSPVLTLYSSRAPQAIARQISGVVSDESSQPLPGVNVLVKGTSTGTTTDATGKFALEVPDESNVLVFSFIGFLTQEVDINGLTTMNVVMTADIQTLGEVVVIGYGEQKKVTVTGSVASTKGEDLKIAPVASVANTLVGRLPGLIAVNRSGEPGADDSNLLIRGVNTFGDNSPLIVVDGVADRAGGFSRIDPNDIESVTILKDASAAIYGSRAANGVILVTTKRGKDGKTRLSYSFNYGLKTPTLIPEMTGSADYATALNEVSTLINGGSPIYSDAEIQKFRDGSDPLNYPNINYVDETFKKWSPLLKHNLNLSGGGEKVSYFASLGYLFEDNYYQNSASDYKQYNLRSNIDIQATKALKFYVNIALRQQDRNSPFQNGDGPGSIFRKVVQADPRLIIEWPGDLLNAISEEGFNPKAITSDLTGYEQDDYTYINGDLGFNLDLSSLAQGLALDGGLFVDKSNGFYKSFNKTYTLYYRNNSTNEYEPRQYGPKNAQLYENMKQSVGITARLKLGYTKTFNDVHNVSTFVGYEQFENNYDELSGGRSNYTSSSLDQLFAGPSSTATNFGTADASARRNYFGRFDYSYAEKYLFQFNWRYDGSQNFPEENRYGFFPGVAVGWRISEEAFWQQSLSAINYFKIRASWGKVGNDRIRYNGEDQRYTYLTNYTFDWHAAFGGASPIAYTGLRQVQTGNPNVTWEVGTMYNLGFESKFFNNAFNFELDLFRQTREKILDQPTAAVPQYAGLSLPAQNFAETESQGFEVVLGYTKNWSDWRFYASANYSLAKSNIVNFNEPSNTPEWQKRTGKSIGADWLLYESIGIFRTQQDLDNYPHLGNATLGDLIYRDVNEDGLLDGNDRIRPDKTAIPQVIYGLNLNLGYKNFELKMLWQGASEFSQYVFYEAGAGYGAYTQDYFDNRWTPDNINSNGPRIYDRQVTTLGQPNTYLLENSSYVRLKNIELSYSLPRTLISRLSIEDVRLSLSGFNVLTITSIKDVDPEAPTSDQGYSGWFNIQQKNYSVGLNVTF